MPFAEAVQRCAGGGSAAREAHSHVHSLDEDEAGTGTPPVMVMLPPVLHAGERYYLRSVGLDPRKDAAVSASIVQSTTVTQSKMGHG